MKVICISGKAQHGKDTTASLLRDALENDGYTVLIAHYGDLVKYVCKTFFGWNGEKDEYGRSLLQHVGTDVIRNQQEDYWVGFIGDMLRMSPGEWDYVLIPDCRFPNEVEYLRGLGFDVTHVRVLRENFVSPLTEEQQAHPSETALDDVAPDFWVINYGSLQDLKHAISSLISSMNGYHQIHIDEFVG